MDTVASTPVEPELNLLLDWGQPDDAARRRKAVITTALVHVAAIATLFLLPASFFENKRLLDVATRITPIFEPLTPLTQRAPNTKAPKEFSPDQPGMHGHLSLPTLPPAASPRVRPTPAPPPPPPTPVKKAVVPQPPPPKPMPATTPLPEPPKVDATGSAPKVDLPQLGTIAPPKIQAEEQPKLPLQNLSQGPPPVAPPDQRRIPLPDTSVSGAIQRSLQQASPPRPPVPVPGDNPALQLPQLLSDAQGADFTNYLRTILLTVRRNWQSVIPQSAKMYGQTKVSIVLSIEHTGMLGKVIIYRSSGYDPLDQAAVTGISMSQPFPPFPPDFKGNEIRIQFNFAYNSPKQ